MPGGPGLYRKRFQPLQGASGVGKTQSTSAAMKTMMKNLLGHFEILLLHILVTAEYD